MNDVVNSNVFLVKEHLGIFKAANNFDIYDPASGEIIMECREPSLGLITKLLRFTDYKRMTPFDVQITTPSGERVVRILRGISLFVSKVEVRDQDNEVIGSFQQKFFSIGGRFDVLDMNEPLICTLQDMHRLGLSLPQRRQRHCPRLQRLQRPRRELFTSADNHVL